MMKLDIFDAANSKQALIRNMMADYLKVGEDWHLMGAGFTKLDESPGAQSESETYINEVTSSASITRYETSFAYDTRLVPSQPAVYALWKTGRDHLTGDAAQFEYVRVDLFNPIGEATEDAAEFTARKFIVSNEVSSLSGNGGEKMQASGNLNAVGDPVQGKFDTVTKTFTEGTFAGKYDTPSSVAAAG